MLTTKEQALLKEVAAQMEALAVLAEGAESGQAGAESAGLERIQEIERLERMLEAERAASRGRRVPETA